MEELNYIQDEQLPLLLNFNTLREEGLAYIQEYSGSQWTNLNTSDPGVTILDQLCYALTELGYCGNFPIKDLLTDAQGDLEVKNQFYLPEEILTTSPITDNDYIKYIIDRVREVQNVVIIPISSTSLRSTTFQVYVSINPQIEDKDRLNTICKSVFFLLNTARNLGNIFLMPKILEPITYAVYGQLKIKKGYQAKNVMAQIQYAINDYIFPKVVQAGYGQLKKEGYTTDEIFNGPILNNGWIPNAALKPKKNSIQAFEITEVIESVAGVEGVGGLYFKDSDNASPLYKIEALHQQIIVLQSIGTLGAENQGQLSEGQFQNKLNFSAALAATISNANQIAQVGALQLSPELPIGKFRDVPSYISIQNTIPGIYAVGKDAVNEKTSELQIAQSRQLKGYLTLFDQVLANEFAQLASLGKLFSFKNGDSGYVEGANTVMTVKAQEELEGQYPVPYKNFSPTYFYQSLYASVPDIEPLLKNNNTFGFTYSPEPVKELNKNAWEGYKDDPYNAYIRGLLSITEEDTVNLNRRNSILDHILARHGISPLHVDNVIEGAPYSGNSLKDMVIIKSMLLQNLDRLSYNRARGYNFTSASKIPSRFRSVTKKMQEQFLQGFEKDFILTSNALTNETLITTQDYIDYSALELKLSLLFSLKARYQNYLATQNNKLALWLIEQRKGLIMIEADLFLSSADFEVCIAQEQTTNTCWKVNGKLTYDALVGLEIGFLENPKAAIENLAIQNQQTTQNMTLSKAAKCTWDKNWFVPLGKTGYTWAVQASWDGKEAMSLNDPLFQNKIIVVFPDFVPSINTACFKNKVALFLKNELSLELTSSCFYLGKTSLEAFIKAYTQWHNDLIFNAEESDFNITLQSKSAGEIVAQIKQLNNRSNG